MSRGVTFPRLIRLWYNRSMKITILPPLDLEVRANQYTERSGGLHLSQITQDIMVTSDPDRYGQDQGGAKWMNFIMGLVFERALERAWLDRELTGSYRPGLIRPGEVTKDGITGTPDAYDFIAGEPEEFKCTKKSCRQDITDKKFWLYWIQLKAYAYMLGCNSGVLRVIFINGNYSHDDNDPESGYVMRSWRAEWTQLELDETWFMLVSHARRRGWL